MVQPEQARVTHQVTYAEPAGLAGSAPSYFSDLARARAATAHMHHLKLPLS